MNRTNFLNASQLDKLTEREVLMSGKCYLEEYISSRVRCYHLTPLTEPYVRASYTAHAYYKTTYGDNKLVIEYTINVIKPYIIEPAILHGNSRHWTIRIAPRRHFYEGTLSFEAKFP